MWSVLKLAPVVVMESSQLPCREAVNTCRGQRLAAAAWTVAVELRPTLKDVGADPHRLAGLKVGRLVVEGHGGSVVDSLSIGDQRRISAAMVASRSAVTTRTGRIGSHRSQSSRAAAEIFSMVCRW